MKRLLGLSLVTLTGVVTGIAVTAVHPRWSTFALGAAATISTALACAPGWSRCVYGAAWILPVALFMVPRSEGDYLVAADAHGYALIGLALVLITLATVTIPRPRPSPDTSRQQAVTARSA